MEADISGATTTAGTGADRTYNPRVDGSDARPWRVRVVCMTDDGLVLLLRWRDPFDGRAVWEPPGGGIDAGETALDAAQREMREETGLAPVLQDDWSVQVPRDFVWAGVHHRHLETFFLARLPKPVDIETALQTDDEQKTFRGYLWADLPQVQGLDGSLEPTNLAEIVAGLMSAAAVQSVKPP